LEFVFKFMTLKKKLNLKFIVLILKIAIGIPFLIIRFNKNYFNLKIDISILKITILIL